MTMQRSMFFASVLLLIAAAFVFWADSTRVDAIALTPTLTGETEYCVTCHTDLPEISPSHPVDAFGCVVCHGGERLALDADLAHSTMRGGNNPSDLSVVQESCGGADCHSGTADDPSSHHIPNVMTSIQATYAGAIASIRFTFGEQDSLTAEQGVFAVTDPHTSTGITGLDAFQPFDSENPFIHSFGENCLTCHLSAEPMPGEDFARLTGCAACHTPDVNSFEDGQIHRLTTAIPYTQCNTCHNRGNYNLRTMTFDERTDDPVGRFHDYYQPIGEFVQCEWTLDCIDCHTQSEAMGNGDLHSNQAEIQYIQCKTCHGTLDELPLTHTIVSEDDPALASAFLNPLANDVLNLQVGDTILMTEQGEPMWNARVRDDGAYEMVGKATGAYFTFYPVMGTQCEQQIDQQESRYCHECHAVDRDGDGFHP